MAGFVSDTLRLVQSPGQSSVPGLGQEESGEETEQTRPSEHRLRQPVHLVHLPQPGDVGDGEHPQGPDHVAEAGPGWGTVSKDQFVSQSVVSGRV